MPTAGRLATLWVSCVLGAYTWPAADTLSRWMCLLIGVYVLPTPCVLLLCLWRNARVQLASASYGVLMLIAGYCVLASFSGKRVGGDEGVMIALFMFEGGVLISGALLLAASTVALVVGLVRWADSRCTRPDEPAVCPKCGCRPGEPGASQCPNCGTPICSGG
jgi:hypothetical protein